MTLREARCTFTVLMAKLVLEANARGFQTAGNELVRDARIAKLNAQSGAGVSNSLHLSGLAIDLLLYKNGVYLTRTEDYKGLGEWWKQQHPNCRWGGDIKSRPDGNHFSFTLWEGRI